MEETMTRRKNLFGTVLTYAAPSSNYRGESEENRTMLQKISKGGKEYSIVSPEAMRNALREKARGRIFRSRHLSIEKSRTLLISIRSRLPAKIAKLVMARSGQRRFLMQSDS